MYQDGTWRQATAHTDALCLPVAFVQLDHFILQLFRVIWREAELADVVAAVLVGVVVAELRLDGVGAQQGQRDERAGQPTRHNVISQLQAEVVPATEHRSGLESAPPSLPQRSAAQGPARGLGSSTNLQTARFFRC